VLVLLDELVVVVLVVVDVELLVALVVARPPLPPFPEALDDVPPVPVGCASLMPKMALHAESKPPQSASAKPARRPNP
jgi:hypothetical protein